MPVKLHRALTARGNLYSIPSRKLDQWMQLRYFVGLVDVPGSNSLAHSIDEELKVTFFCYPHAHSVTFYQQFKVTSRLVTNC